MSREATLVDPGLGLLPVGAVAFMGLWLLLAWLVPILLTGLPDIVGVVIAVLLLAAGLGAFFLSLLGLHRQMVKVKEHELELARGLYAEAYEPVRQDPSLWLHLSASSRSSAQGRVREARPCDPRLAYRGGHMGLGHRHRDERSGDCVRTSRALSAGAVISGSG
jgi:hypothetical protein